MRASFRECAWLALFVVATITACGGPRATPLAPVGADTGASRVAPLTLLVRLPAAFAGTTLGARVYPDGAAVPDAPGASVALDSAACVVSGAERACTLALRVPVGLDDVALLAGSGNGALRGTAPRQLVPPAGAMLSLAFDGAPARWTFSPSMPAGAADGMVHLVPFAVLAQDGRGFTLLAGAPSPPATVTLTGDGLHALALTAQGNGEFVARYDGQPIVGGATLSASAPGAAPATASFASLVVNPTSFEIAQGSSVTLGASLANAQGAFTATTGSNCAVSPAAATPASAGGTVNFTVRLLSGEGCSVTLESSSGVPIVIPGKKTVGRPQIDIGPSKIQHVVVLFQENRSFDNIFGGLDKNGNPFPGADTVSNPVAGEPTPNAPMSTGLLEECYDPEHQHPNSVTDVDGGTMDGFVKEPVNIDSCNPEPTAAPSDYVYRTIEVNASEVLPYWQMGEAYAISDRMFEPSSSESFAPHMYLVSGQSANTIDNPSGSIDDSWGCDNIRNGIWQGYVQVVIQKSGGEGGPGVPPCFNVASLADELDQKGVSWRFYAAAIDSDFGYAWSSLNSFADIREGSDWSSKVISPPAQIVTDVEKGTLAGMTWVTPLNATSDHPQSASNMGPSWITSVVNAIGKSKFWNTTAIFITWDDWGGWYDHVPPPVTGPVSLGIRVPVIIISPYVRPGYVSHVTHTTGSILHFAEEVFNLPSLGQDDAVEDDFADTFNFSQTPLAFGTPIPSRYSLDEVLRAAAATKRTFAKHIDDGD
jgi:phospholipase C